MYEYTEKKQPYNLFVFTTVRSNIFSVVCSPFFMQIEVCPIRVNIILYHVVL